MTWMLKVVFYDCPTKPVFTWVIINLQSKLTLIFMIKGFEEVVGMDNNLF